jgi:hypothetical protein
MVFFFQELVNGITNAADPGPGNRSQGHGSYEEDGADQDSWPR